MFILRNSYRIKSGLSSKVLQFIRSSGKQIFQEMCDQKREKCCYAFDAEALQVRKPDKPVHEMFVSRWSPREMTGEDVSKEELTALLEASRWAPSHFNLQEWRFVYAKRGSSQWQPFINLLWPLNQEWAKNAGVLLMLLSNKFFKYENKKTAIPTNSFDAGSAFMSLALEGSARGYVVHAMGGFDYDKAYAVVGAPKDMYNMETIIAIGKRPAKDKRKMKEQISQRKAVSTFLFEGVIDPKNDKI